MALITSIAPAHLELLGSRDTYVHFVQEPFDQASIVRPYTKWEYNLPSGVIAKEALRRAHTIMQTKPAGPVYFMAQRETLIRFTYPFNLIGAPALALAFTLATVALLRCFLVAISLR